MAHDQRVPAGDRRVVEAHVGREAASDTGPLARERDRPLLAVLLVAEVLARLLDLLPRSGQPRVPVGSGRLQQRPLVGLVSVPPAPAGMRSVLNSEARTKSSPPQPGQSVSMSEPTSVSV